MHTPPTPDPDEGPLVIDSGPVVLNATFQQEQPEQKGNPDGGDRPGTGE